MTRGSFLAIRPVTRCARVVCALALCGVAFGVPLRASLRAAGTAQADARFTPAESESFVRKMAAIERIGGAGPAASTTTRTRGTPGTGPGAGGAPRLTAITERELNAYFRYDMRDQFPAGVTEPTLTILGDGRVTATAVVDLDAVRDGQSSSGWLNPMRFLSGRLPVTASGVIESQHGTARFLLDTVDVSGVPVPKSLLQQVLSYYSRTTENPQGLNLDDAIDLPAGIREIRVQPGQAIVVQ
jgi:hypothetical protein